jgi:outer membrane protein assembly factor BamD (BamD/ComL family)
VAIGRATVSAFLFSVITCSAVFAQTPVTPVKDPVIESFKKALELYKAAKYDEAITSFEDLVKVKTPLEEYGRF